VSLNPIPGKRKLGQAHPEYFSNAGPKAVEETNPNILLLLQRVFIARAGIKRLDNFRIGYTISSVIQLIQEV
jgi:hypothetical protein